MPNTGTPFPDLSTPTAQPTINTMMPSFYTTLLGETLRTISLRIWGSESWVEMLKKYNKLVADEDTPLPLNTPIFIPQSLIGFNPSPSVEISYEGVILFSFKREDYVALRWYYADSTMGCPSFTIILKSTQQTFSFKTPEETLAVYKIFLTEVRKL